MLFEKPKHHQPRVSEFQAIILAGYGSSNSNDRLYPISEEDNLPKALLPVGNKPVISYTLDWLEKAGIYGRLKKRLMQRDFIVIPCDLITELNPRDLLDAHRVHNPTFTALFYEPGSTEASSKDDEPLPYVGIDPTQNALVYKTHRSEDEDFSMRMSLLKKFPRVRVHTDLQDAHLYIFKRWVIDILADKENVESISEDLIPLLVKCQYQRKLVERENIEKYSSTYHDLLVNALSLSTTQSVDIDPSFKTNPTDSNFKSPIKSYVHVYRDGFCGRGNTIASYSELNRYVTKQGANIIRQPTTAEIAPRTQVGNDSVIGEYTKIDEKSSVKKSCVGAHCIIGKNVKIANSVIMDHVVISDNVKIDGCVICHHATILDKAVMKDCEVAGGYTVDKDNTRLEQFRAKHELARNFYDDHEFCPLYEIEEATEHRERIQKRTSPYSSPNHSPPHYYLSTANNNQRAIRIIDPNNMTPVSIHHHSKSDYKTSLYYPNKYYCATSTVVPSRKIPIIDPVTKQVLQTKYQHHVSVR
ncbi:hypothetical protein G6F60_002057 [Rhizopus arrhizus]|nr:hypothetical protein G6F60_002057 [Rhizopus arrhizus]